MKVSGALLVSCLTLAMAGTAFAQAQDVYLAKEDYQSPKKEYSPYVEDHFPNQVYFGDTHLHTSWSTDVGLIGATLGPDKAYRVSRGEEVTAYSGLKVKLIRPLDFIVVADHAENLGLADFIRRSDPILLANKTGKKWHDMNKAGKGYDAFIEWLRSDKEDLINEPRMMQSMWTQVVENADEYYQPGVFTTFHGYEWTSMPDGNNLHRVVIFRDGGDKTSQILPFSAFDSPDPEGLWEYLAAYEKKTGGQVLAIPHNGNLSNGLMFDTQTYTGKPLTKSYAQTRIQYEPLYEVTQMKGDAETHPLLSPDDEFADFENMDAGNISGKVAKTNAMLPKEYGRAALKEGLSQEKKLGVNPYKFGMIGSTDAHTGIPSSREENNFGKAHIVEPSADRVNHVIIEGAKPELSILAKDLGASGLAAVWARENTREALWDAMKRKEVYATTGNRLIVRVFGGWDFEADEVHRPDFAKQGYKRGVPMGGDLTNAPKGKAPGFMIRALRDADGPNLDRVQIIKGWLDKKGNTHEKIYDVAVSDGRKIGKDGRARTPVGSTVNIADASYTNTIGEPLMAAYWVDPDFDPRQRAFYYVRVIEIPTPRWTAYDAKFFNVKMPKDTKVTVQDRAYTSPIWYTPKQ
ncbi:MAG: DUF3604 domain-containing protein [Gammaproteobacteria bacterium]|nr:MAG: DUF3604 domain-containing protein [Gammaproteobacteria bacterium]